MSELVQMVGQRIRQLRLANNQTQEALADLTGLSLSYLSDLERGTRNVTIDTLGKIIEAFNVAPAEIFNFTVLNLISNSEDIEQQQTLEALFSILSSRSLAEVQFIHRMAKDFIKTVDKL